MSKTPDPAAIARAAELRALISGGKPSATEVEDGPSPPENEAAVESPHDFVRRRMEELEGGKED